MIRILTIGNSFAENATRLLQEFAAADAGVKFLIGAAGLGGCSLEKHCNLLDQCKLFPHVKPYPFTRTGMEIQLATLREILVAEPWDYVTLQQKSGLSSLIETYEPYFGRLMTLIQELAPTAQPLVHQT